MFKNKIVNDLHYAIFSNSLLDFEESIHDILFGLDEKIILDWLSELDDNIDSLHSFVIDNNSIRLGKYFEKLIQFYFLWHPNVEIIEFSMQIFEEKETIGELDFLIYDKINKEYLHIEVAVKFFVKKINCCEYKDFVCPNGLRNLATKVDKSLNRQLKLLNTSSGKNFLDSISIRSVKSLLLVRGAIFYFEKDPLTNCSNLSFSNKHNRFSAQFYKELKFNQKLHFKLLNNHQWMCLSTLTSNDGLLDFSQLKLLVNEHFSLTKNAVVVGVFQEHKNSFVEIDKLAILHTNWPNFS